MSGRKPLWAIALAAIGILILLFQVGIVFVSAFTSLDVHLNHGVSVIATGLGFVGFYRLHPERTTTGAKVLVASVVDLAHAIPLPAFMRAGRRKTDAIVVTEEHEIIPATAEEAEVLTREDAERVANATAHKWGREGDA